MIYIQLNNTVTFYNAPETIERAIHNLLMCRDDTEVGMGYDGALTQPAYEQGLNDAWECARKLMLRSGLSYADIYKIFGNGSEHFVLRTFSPSEAIAKINAYEEARKKAEAEIKVGDEVDDGVGLAVIIGIRDDGTYDGLADTGGHVHITCVHKKTGRHFSQIDEVVKQMKGK